ncbi:MAG: DUF1566 domain-containing protein [Myxococcaceae bacterium]|nr:DUF1566 domain-containing protein [Myxococcaceae bacterium]
MIRKCIFLFLMSPFALGQMSMGSRGLSVIRQSFVSSLVFSRMHRGTYPRNFSAQRAASNSVARTLPMRVNPLRNVNEGYTGPRRSAVVPALEWELNRANSPMMTLRQAQAYAASRVAEGWRLPTIWELEALHRQQEVLDEDFNNDNSEEDLLEGSFWSATPVMDGSDYVWSVYFALDPDHDEPIEGCYKRLKLRVRLVRDAR